MSHPWMDAAAAGYPHPPLGISGVEADTSSSAAPIEAEPEAQTPGRRGTRKRTDMQTARGDMDCMCRVQCRAHPPQRRWRASQRMQCRVDGQRKHPQQEMPRRTIAGRRGTRSWTPGMQRAHGQWSTMILSAKSPGSLLSSCSSQAGSGDVSWSASVSMASTPSMSAAKRRTSYPRRRNLSSCTHLLLLDVLQLSCSLPHLSDHESNLT